MRVQINCHKFEAINDVDSDAAAAAASSLTDIAEGIREGRCHLGNIDSVVIKSRAQHRNPSSDSASILIHTEHHNLICFCLHSNRSHLLGRHGWINLFHFCYTLFPTDFFLLSRSPAGSKLSSLKSCCAASPPSIGCATNRPSSFLRSFLVSSSAAKLN